VILVCGEALIDLAAVDVGGERLYRGHPGGGPRNTAVALARLGVPVAFCGRLSTDAFGRRLRDDLRANGVDDRFVVTGPEPTTLALAEVGPGGVPRFSFWGDGTADRLLAPGDLPATLDGVEALHVGTLSLVLEPGAATIEGLMARAAGRCPVMVDPNVRPAVLGDRAEYLARLQRWLGWSDIVKVSDADLAWLVPDEAPEATCRAWSAGGGPALVVLTRGDRGATAFWPGHELTVPAPAVDVVDTIGAGDAFGAGLLAALRRHGALRPDRLAALDAGLVEAAVAFAVEVAAASCTRAGADPPRLAELGAPQR
jgi:fructokinase